MRGGGAGGAGGAGGHLPADGGAAQPRGTRAQSVGMRLRALTARGVSAEWWHLEPPGLPPPPPGPGWDPRPGGERTPELRAGGRGGLETGRLDRHLRAALSQLRAGAPGGREGTPSPSPVYLGRRRFLRLFVCSAAPPCLPACRRARGGAGGYASGRRRAAAPESLTGLRWQRAPLRSAPPAPRTQRGHAGCTGTAHIAARTDAHTGRTQARKMRGARRVGCHPPPQRPAPRRWTRRPPSLWPRPFEVGETSCPEVLWPDLSAPRASLARKSFDAGGGGRGGEPRSRRGHRRAPRCRASLPVPGSEPRG